MKINEAGLNLIKQFESCRLKAYPDPATGGEPITIGWGHTGGVKLGDVITQAQADAWLLEDVAKFEQGVSELVKVSLSGNQYSALVSFAYNCGLANLKKSSLLRKLNAGDIMGAADEFPKWNRGGGRVLPGLVRRRKAERELFLKE